MTELEMQSTDADFEALRRALSQHRMQVLQQRIREARRQMWERACVSFDEAVPDPQSEKVEV